MVKRWGDQWWWRVEVKFKDNQTQLHQHLTLETAKAIERNMKRRDDVKKVTKSREGNRA